MYRNEELNTSIYESSNRQSEASSIIQNDGKVYFMMTKNKSLLNRKKVQDVKANSNLINLEQNESDYNNSNVALNRNNNNYCHKKTYSDNCFINHTSNDNNNNNSVYIRNRNNKSPITSFTKVSENIFNDIKNNNYNTLNYDDLTNEQTLMKEHIKLHGGYSDNNTIIQNFLERAGINNKKQIETNNDISFNFQDEQHYNISKSKSPLKNDEFISSQKEYEMKKKEKVDKLKAQIQQEESKNYRNKPLINSTSVKIVEMKRNKNNDALNSNAFMRLYYHDKKPFNTVTNSINCSFCKDDENNNHNNIKGINNKNGIKQISNTAYLKLQQFQGKQMKKNKSYVKGMNITSISSKESNMLILNKFLPKFKTAIDQECNNNNNEELSRSNNDDIISVNQTEFINILINLNFIHNPYSSNEGILINKAWSALTQQKEETETELTIPHTTLLLFCLNVLGIPSHDSSTKKPTKYLYSNLILQYPSIANSFTYIGKILPNQKAIYVTYSLMSKNYFASLHKYNKTPPPHPNTAFKETPTFKPHKQPTNLLYEKAKSNHTKMNMKIEEHRKEQMNQQLIGCSFKPDLSLTQKRNASHKSEIPLVERLYLNSKKKQMNKQHLLNNSNTNNDTNLNTYKPSLTEYNENIFKENPLQNDKAHKEHLLSLEKNRNENEKKKDYFAYGWTSSKMKEDIDKNIKKNEYRGAFLFANEMKCNKDTFDKYKKVSPRQKLISEFSFEIDIELDGKAKLLIVKKGEDVYKKVEIFAQKYKLNEEGKEKIIRAIKDNLKNKIN